MGGAASSQGAEAMIAATFMLGQAMNRVFPDIYTLSDFHAFREDLLKQQRQRHLRATNVRFMALKDGKLVPLNVEENGETGALEEETEGQEACLSADKKQEILKRCIQVRYQGQDFPIKEEDLYTPNQAGWTPLHACCHQHSGVEAARLLVDEMIKRGISLNTKTVRGPGSFASGWTPLHIACAYGIEATAKCLIAAGATVTTQNSAGWTPLHEAVHRGFDELVQALLEAGAEHSELIPACIMTPYHPQYPLAHACRQGHIQTAKCLLAAGAKKDAQNPQGWSALHEAVFFRRLDCVKTLLVHGCDTTLRTSKGHGVLDFPTSDEIREILSEASAASAKAAKTEKDKEQKVETMSKNSQPEKRRQESFRLLGDLPEMPTSRNITSVEFAKGQNNAVETTVPQKRKKKKKTKRHKNKNKMKTAPPKPGVPSELACHLTGNLMEDPVTSPYGNNFDRKPLEQWFSTQGNLCPVTGLPYSAAELRSNERLKEAIKLYRSGSNQAGSDCDEAKTGDDYRLQLEEESEDDIYDF